MSKATIRPEDEILAELADVGRQIANHEASLEQLYPRRLALFQEAKRDHGTVNRVLGEHVGVDENAVIAALRKAKAKAEAAAKPKQNGSSR